MDFELDEKLCRLRDAAAAFAREQLNDDILDRDERRVFWKEGWRKCASFGIQGLPVPEAYGGGGKGLLETIAAMEGLGLGCPDNGLILAINATLWTVTTPLMIYGTEEQKQRFLPGLCDGSLVGANGASEVDAGSDIFSMKTRAERRGDSWIINGSKTWVTAGPVADVYVCYATTDATRGFLGVSAFIIPRDATGFRVVREIHKMGLRTVPMGELAFEDCVVPAENLLGREGRGAEVFNASMEWERGAILASVLGVMRRQLDRCIEHARSRRQFGQPIGKFQSVSNRIVDMALRLETCRPLVYRIGRLKAEGKDATLESAMAKLHVSECYTANSLDAVRLFGASGFVNEFGIEKDLRDSVGGLIYSGTSDIQRNVIAKRLLKL